MKGGYTGVGKVGIKPEGDPCLVPHEYKALSNWAGEENLLAVLFFPVRNGTGVDRSIGRSSVLGAVPHSDIEDL